LYAALTAVDVVCYEQHDAFKANRYLPTLLLEAWKTWPDVRSSISVKLKLSM